MLLRIAPLHCFIVWLFFMGLLSAPLAMPDLFPRLVPVIYVLALHRVCTTRPGGTG